MSLDSSATEQRTIQTEAASADRALCARCERAQLAAMVSSLAAYLRCSECASKVARACRADITQVCTANTLLESCCVCVVAVAMLCEVRARCAMMIMTMIFRAPLMTMAADSSLIVGLTNRSLLVYITSFIFIICIIRLTLLWLGVCACVRMCSYIC